MLNGLPVEQVPVKVSEVPAFWKRSGFSVNQCNFEYLYTKY